MRAVDQLDYVDPYFRPWHGRLRNIGDLYCAILWPAGVGQPDSAVLFKAGGSQSKLYLQNKGLVIDRNRAVTRGEVTAKVRAMLTEGLLAANAV